MRRAGQCRCCSSASVCSSDDRPSLIYKLLAHLQAGDWQAPSGCLPLQAAIPRDNGCTFLGAWLHVRMQRLLEADERVGEYQHLHWHAVLYACIYTWQ